MFLPSTVSSVTGVWNGGSWLGCGDLPAMGAVFSLGAGWPQWKPLGIPGTYLPLKRGSWLIKKKKITQKRIVQNNLASDAAQNYFSLLKPKSLLTP